MDNIWILIAHRAGAKIFRRNRPSDGIELVQEIPFELGRRKNREVNTDRPGRLFASVGDRRHGLGSHVEPDEHYMDQFAKQLVDLLAKRSADNAYAHLLLVADPQFLGRLRVSLPKPIARLVAGELVKNVEKMPEHEILPILQPTLLDIERQIHLNRTA